jgi:hypothetical protein
MYLIKVCQKIEKKDIFWFFLFAGSGPLEASGTLAFRNRLTSRTNLTAVLFRSLEMFFPQNSIHQTDKFNWDMVFN